MANTQPPKPLKPSGIQDEADGGAIDFEFALADVERIVAELEGGELGLAESLGRYELGVKRLKQCHQWLSAAEQRVSVLAGFDAEGNPVTEPMEAMEVRGGSGREKSATPRQRTAKRAKQPMDGYDIALNRPKDEHSVDDSPGLF